MSMKELPKLVYKSFDDITQSAPLKTIEMNNLETLGVIQEHFQEQSILAEHCTIQRRNNKIYVIDKSVDGTYAKLPLDSTITLPYTCYFILGNTWVFPAHNINESTAVLQFINCNCECLETKELQLNKEIIIGSESAECCVKFDGICGNHVSIECLEDTIKVKVIENNKGIPEGTWVFIKYAVFNGGRAQFRIGTHSSFSISLEESNEYKLALYLSEYKEDDDDAKEATLQRNSISIEEIHVADEEESKKKSDNMHATAKEEESKKSEYDSIKQEPHIKEEAEPERTPPDLNPPPRIGQHDESEVEEEAKGPEIYTISPKPRIFAPNLVNLGENAPEGNKDSPKTNKINFQTLKLANNYSDLSNNQLSGKTTFVQSNSHDDPILQYIAPITQEAPSTTGLANSNVISAPMTQPPIPKYVPSVAQTQANYQSPQIVANPMSLSSNGDMSKLLSTGHQRTTCEFAYKFSLNKIENALNLLMMCDQMGEDADHMTILSLREILSVDSECAKMLLILGFNNMQRAIDIFINYN